MFQSRGRVTIVAAVAAVSALLTGCGSNQYQLAPVRGRITCQGKPVAGAVIKFLPIDAPDKTGRPAGHTGSPSHGKVQADGSFTLTAMDGKSGSGALIGPHRVVVEPPPTRRPTLIADERAVMSPEEIKAAEESNSRLPVYPPLPCSVNPEPGEVEVKPGDNEFTFTLKPKQSLLPELDMRAPRARCRVGLTWLLTCGVLIAAGRSAAGDGFDWRTGTPESQGISGPKLAALTDKLAAQKSKTFLVIRNDTIVREWYGPERTASTPHFTASTAKAVVAGLSLAVAMGDGLIALDDPAAKYVRQWRNDPRKSKITIRHLGSHTSGLEDSSVAGISHPNEPGWKGEFWKRLNPPNDPFSISRDQTPLLFDPGAKFQYSNPGIAMLTYAVTAAMRDAPQKDIRTLLRDRVMQPIGVPDKEWSIGYGTTYTVDGLPLVGSWGGGSYTARALARVGRLMLRQGDWDGKQLIPKEAVRQVTADAGLPGNIGMGWWTNGGGRRAGTPRDAFWAAGAGDQILLVVPSLNLIAVRNGEKLDALFFDELIAAVEGR